MRRCGPVLITCLKQQGYIHLVLRRLYSGNPYNNKIHQTSYNPVTFAELNHFILLCLSLSASLFVALFWTIGFEQLRVSWLCASNHSHVYCFSRIRQSASDSFSQQNHHCNTTKHTVYGSIMVSLLLHLGSVVKMTLIIFSVEFFVCRMKLSSETMATINSSKSC